MLISWHNGVDAYVNEFEMQLSITNNNIVLIKISNMDDHKSWSSTMWEMWKKFLPHTLNLTVWPTHVIHSHPSSFEALLINHVLIVLIHVSITIMTFAFTLYGILVTIIPSHWYMVSHFMSGFRLWSYDNVFT